jgi:hypothetical protein
VDWFGYETEGKRSSGFEGGAGHSALSNDCLQGSDSDFSMIGNGDCHCTEVGSPLHDDMASSSTDFLKTVLFEDAADISSREDAKLTHEPLRSG